MELSEFLLARIAEDEERASLAARLGPQWQPGGRGVWAEATTVLASDGRLAGSGRSVAEVDDVAAAHVLTWDPARVLAECDAKRRIVDRWRICVQNYDEGNQLEARVLNWTMRLFALPYADDADYDPGWGF